MNFHDISISIFVIEHSVSYLPPDIAYLVKLNTITIESYTDSLDTPDYATIKIDDSVTPNFSPKSKFVLISDLSSNLPNIISNPSTTSDESVELSKVNIGFQIVGTNFIMRRMNLESKVDNPDFRLFNTAYLESKSMNLSDLFIKGYGGIQDNVGPLNMDVSNINIDFSHHSLGFFINTYCSHAGATTQNEIIFDNIMVISSDTKTLSVTSPVVAVNGGANMTVMNSNFVSYIQPEVKPPTVALSTSSQCNPDDSVLQTITMRNNSFNVVDPHKFVELYVTVWEDQHRPVQVTVEDIRFIKHTDQPVPPLISVICSKKSEILVKNIQSDILSFTELALSIQNSAKVELNSITFQDVEHFYEALIEIDDTDIAHLNNVTIDNCSSMNSNSKYFIHYFAENGQLTIDGLTMMNMESGSKNLIKLTTLYYLKIYSSNMQNITSTGAIISSPNLKTIDVDGLNLTTVSGSTLFDFTGFDLEGSEILSIANVIITNSTVPVMDIDRISNFNGTSSSLTIANFQYLDSSFAHLDGDYPLFAFRKLQHEFDFDIFIND